LKGEKMAFSFNGLAAEVEISGAISTSPMLPSNITLKSGFYQVNNTGVTIKEPNANLNVYFVGVCPYVMAGGGTMSISDSASATGSPATGDTTLIYNQNCQSGTITQGMNEVFLNYPRKVTTGIRFFTTVNSGATVYWLEEVI